MPMPQHCRLAMLLLGVTGACSPPHVPLYVAPTNETVQAESEPSYGGGFSIFVQNTSTVPIRVTGLSLYDCTNVRNRCDLIRLNVLVAARARVRVGGVEPGSPDRGTEFRYSFTWAVEQHQPAPH